MKVIIEIDNPKIFSYFMISITTIDKKKIHTSTVQNFLTLILA